MATWPPPVTAIEGLAIIIGIYCEALVRRCPHGESPGVKSKHIYYRVSERWVIRIVEEAEQVWILVYLMELDNAPRISRCIYVGAADLKQCSRSNRVNTDIAAA